MAQPASSDWFFAPSKPLLHGFLSFIFLTTFLFLGYNSLWDQDEAAYAGLAQNILESGNWLSQDFFWAEIHRKPPLHIWAIVCSYHVFGVNEFAVRFPSALFVLGTYLLVYFKGRENFGGQRSFLALIVLSTSLLVPALAHVAVTDAALLFFSILSGFSLLTILNKSSRLWVFLFWFGVSMGMMVKGPPILISTGVFGLLVLLFHPLGKHVWRLKPFFLFPLALVPIVLWGWLVVKNGGEDMIAWMVDWYILKRTTGGVLGQVAPPGVHFLLICLFFLPYILWVPKAFWNGISALKKQVDGEQILLGSWLIAGWLFFELAPSKLPAYTVVTHVPLSFLIAGLLVKSGPTKLVKGAIIFGLAFHLILNLVALPLIEPIKNSSTRVANYLLEHANTSSAVFIGNTRGKPPSLPFYLGEGFRKIVEMKDIDDLWESYERESPAILILNGSQKDEFLERDVTLEFEKVEGQFMDRPDKSTYWILRNELAKK